MAAIGVVGYLVLDGELPDVEHAIRDAGPGLGAWAYAVVGVLAFLETSAFVGLAVPGEVTVVVGGMLAGRGSLDLSTLTAVVWIAAVAGDTTGYLLGRTLGRPFVEEHGHRFYLTPYRLRTVEEFVDAHGAKAIIFGRFVGVLRAFGPFTAGASGLSAGRFIIADVVGAGVWAAVFTTLGYVFASRVDDVFAALGHAQIILVSSLVVGAAVVVISRRRRGGRAERSAASAAGTDNRDSATASGDRYGREMGGCRDEI